MSFDRATAILDEAIARRVTPCAVAEVGRSAGVLWREARGSLTYDPGAPNATTATLFDLASLTKVVATTTRAMHLVESGRLAPEARVVDFLPGWGAEDRASVTLRDLLEHCAGLPAVLPFYETCHGREAFEAAICAAPLAYSPRARSIYSDLGFILVGFILEDSAGARLDAQFADVVESLQLPAEDLLRYGPLATADEQARVLERVAPTQVDAWRGGRLLRGEVDDRNCAALGSVAGHAGLFGSAGAVGQFARRVLRGRLGERANGLAAPGTFRRFLTRSTVPGSSRALGWDLIVPTSSCGTLMSEQAFGHTGYTGTSLWIDPAVDVYVVLLTNRVHPQAGSPEPIRELRRDFHDAVMTAVKEG